MVTIRANAVEIGAPVWSEVAARFFAAWRPRLPVEQNAAQLTHDVAVAFADRRLADSQFAGEFSLIAIVPEALDHQPASAILRFREHANHRGGWPPLVPRAARVE